MARQRDSHSPSRSKREDGYYYDKRKRDDDRSHRRRSRSRSPEVRSSGYLMPGASSDWVRQKRYRESHRTRDRSRDRRNDDHHRSYRDSSRERRRSRERGVKDRRDRSREYRHRRDGSRDRDRDRRRRNDSTDSRRSGRRKDSKERGSSRAAVDKNEVRDSHCYLRDFLTKHQLTKTTSGIADDEKKKAERLAKLEAWKQKLAQAAAEKQQKEIQSAAGTRGLLAEMDKKAAATPTKVISPADPASPESSSTIEETASPKPFTGKFDPKAIAKKATTNSAHAASKLGTDVLLPGQMKPSASSIPVTAGVQANKIAASGITSSGMASRILLNIDPADLSLSIVSSVSLKAKGNLSGFGLATKPSQESEGKPAAKKGLAFEEEESSRKLEKLPSLENGIMDEDAALTNGDKDDDDDEEEEEEEEEVEIEGGTEEETAAAARAAAEKREERLQAQSLQYQAGQEVPGTNGDVSMEAAPLEPVDVEMADEAEELDPLDAYMNDLEDHSQARPTLAAKRKATHEPQAMFGDDAEPDMTAVEQEDNLLTISSKKKKKDIPTVDHAKVNYEPFQKSFYAEPSDLSKLSEEDVANIRLELDGIKVKGVDVPKPAMKWSQCGLSNQIQDVISALKFETPSAIQAQSIPSIMSGRDIIGVAKTGSGKTIAFLLPMFRHIKAQRPLANMDGPIGLVMTPTRELANQIYHDCKPFLKALNLRAVVCYGGAPIKDQIAALKTGAHIVVCTPGRMIDLLAANSGRVTNLRRVTYVVLDEADRMFDMGFEPQVKKILTNCRPDRQAILFSATFPRQMERLAKETLAQPIEIVVGGRSVVAKEITQIVEVREEDTKFHRLLELLGKQYEDDKNEDDRVLIFVDRHEAADSLLGDLMRKGYPCQSIHGGKDQIDRNSALDDFKGGAVVSFAGLLTMFDMLIEISANSHCHIGSCSWAGREAVEVGCQLRRAKSFGRLRTPRRKNRVSLVGSLTMLNMLTL